MKATSTNKAHLHQESNIVDAGITKGRSGTGNMNYHISWSETLEKNKLRLSNKTNQNGKDIDSRF